MELQIIQSKIYGIRGQKVMLDFDLAGLYQVETHVLNQAVKRNSKRFPTDFMFRLNTEEWEILKSQIVISSEYFHYASFCSCPPIGLGSSGE